MQLSGVIINKKTMKSSIISLISLLSLGACTGHETNGVQPMGKADAPPTAAIKAAPCPQTDSFAIQMFSMLAETQKGNFVFSPASLEGVLRLLQQGARGTTATELAALPMGKQGVKTAMNPAEANALFTADGFKLKPGIKTDEVIPTPFATNPQRAAQTINSWAKDNTQGLIPSIISADDIDVNTRLVAANAIYLKEKWLRPFNLRSTRENAEFTLSDGSTTEVNMMRNKAEYHYAEGADWQAVAMFYKPVHKAGEPGCFIGILPKGNARDFACKLTPQQYQDIRHALVAARKQDTIVYLPRFEADPGTYSLNGALQACGLRTIFTPNADLSGFADEPLYLSQVLQRCYVKADEQGTEAAAVTIGMVKCTSAAPPRTQPKVIKFDRPFLWVITDLNSPAAPYFMGIVEKP